MKQNCYLKKKAIMALGLAFAPFAAIHATDWLTSCQAEGSQVQVFQNSVSTTQAIESSFADGMLKFTSTTGQENEKKEFRLLFKPANAAKVTNGEVFIVVEGTNISPATRKLAGMYVNNKKYALTSYNNNFVTLTSNTLANGHTISVLSPLSRNNVKQDMLPAVEKLISLYEENPTFDCSQFELYYQFKNTGEETAIYNVALYTLGELLQKYPELKGQWRYDYANDIMPKLAKATLNNTFSVLSSKVGTYTPTPAFAGVMMRALGGMPSDYTTINLHGFTFDTTAEPLAYDCFDGIFQTDDVAKQRVIMDADQFRFFPTFNPTITKNGYMYYAYKSGIDPRKVVEKRSGKPTEYFYSYTANLEAGYNSCIVPFAVDVANLPKGLTAFVFGSVSGGNNVNFKTAEGIINANTPFIIKADATGLYLIPTTTAGSKEDHVANAKNLKDYYSTSEESSAFVGSYVYKAPSADFAGSSLYGLVADGSGFKKMAADTYTSYHRAFLKVDDAMAAAKLNITFDDDLTAISSIKTDTNTNANKPIYNLAGQRIDNNYKGIVIINGKKYIR